ncbi:MAG TPA: cell division protein FtsL, partial [Clostridiaceae bacterium]|nr:cell division protein FtsL [Clostridiaceae bacterium]
MLMVVFCMFFLIMYRYAMITELNYEIVEAESDYNKIKDNNARLMVEIEKETDLRKIKEIAEEKLNMKKPDKFQTVYISVPKNDFTVVADAYKETGDKENTNILTALLEKAGKFAQLLY